MNRVISALIGAVAGAIGGYILADRLLQKKYQALEDEAVQSVREALGKERPKPAPKTEDTPKEDKKSAAEKAVSKPDLKHYVRYNQYYAVEAPDAPAAEEPKEKEEVKNAPYIIAPDEFGSEDYDEVSLTLYADGTLVDEDDRPLSTVDIQAMVGEDNLAQMGKYESDAIHIRNDAKQTDYEILADMQSWNDYLAEHPYIRDDD